MGLEELVFISKGPLPGFSHSFDLEGGLNFIFIFTWSTSFPRVFAFLLVPIFVLCERFFFGIWTVIAVQRFVSPQLSSFFSRSYTFFFIGF